MFGWRDIGKIRNIIITINTKDRIDRLEIYRKKSFKSGYSRIKLGVYK